MYYKICSICKIKRRKKAVWNLVCQLNFLTFFGIFDIFYSQKYKMFKKCPLVWFAICVGIVAFIFLFIEIACFFTFLPRFRFFYFHILFVFLIMVLYICLCKLLLLIILFFCKTSKANRNRGKKGRGGFHAIYFLQKTYVINKSKHIEI